MSSVISSVANSALICRYTHHPPVSTDAAFRSRADLRKSTFHRIHVRGSPSKRNNFNIGQSIWCSSSELDSCLVSRQFDGLRASSSWGCQATTWKAVALGAIHQTIGLKTKSASRGSLLVVSYQGSGGTEEAERTAERIKAFRHTELQQASAPPQVKQVQQFQPWMAAGAVGAVLVMAIGVSLFRRPKEDLSVDALTRRGFISADRSEPNSLIDGYSDPTSVRDYTVNNTTLMEIEPLPPLSSEKIRYHRQLRLQQHGWQKPEIVLVEGDPIPAGVDPGAVRFIPRKHPFALAQDEMPEEWNEEVTRRRLKQRKGRPEKSQQELQQRLDRLRMEQVPTAGSWKIKDIKDEDEQEVQEDGSGVSDEESARFEPVVSKKVSNGSGGRDDV